MNDSHRIHCTCGGRAGFTCINGWWVCSTCLLPRRLYMEGHLQHGSSTAEEREGNEVGLILFKGGPLDGNAYETKTLLGLESLNLPILEYVWTSEKITSERTGATAQVWRHQSIAADAPPVTPPAPAAAPTTQVGSPTATEASETDLTVVAPVEPGVEVTDFQSTEPAQTGEAVEANREQVEQTLEAPGTVAGTTSPAPAPAPVSGEVVASTGELPSGESLLELRKSLKLSRGDVVDRCGLAHSKIASIEAGTGKRVKPEEIRLLSDTLNAFAAERGGAGARS